MLPSSVRDFLFGAPNKANGRDLPGFEVRVFVLLDIPCRTGQIELHFRVVLIDRGFHLLDHFVLGPLLFHV